METKQDIQQALQNLINQDGDMIKSVLASYGVTNDPTPEVLILAVHKYGRSFIDDLALAVSDTSVLGDFGDMNANGDPVAKKKKTLGAFFSNAWHKIVPPKAVRQQKKLDKANKKIADNTRVINQTQAEQDGYSKYGTSSNNQNPTPDTQPGYDPRQDFPPTTTPGATPDPNEGTDNMPDDKNKDKILGLNKFVFYGIIAVLVGVLGYFVVHKTPKK